MDRLQHGTEAVRCQGVHGLDLNLLMKLAKTFECHALEAKATADGDEDVARSMKVLEERAATYYKAALAAMDK